MSARKSGLGRGLDELFMDNNLEITAELLTISTEEIEPNKAQPRKRFDDEALAALADSIREHGVLQPIVVRPLPRGNYQIVAGERRWRACRMLGISHIPVVIKEIDDLVSAELALVENLQREDLSPIEEAQGFRELIETHGLTQEEVANKVGKSRPAIANSLRLLSLPEKVSAMVDKGSLSAGHARALLPIESAETIQKLAYEIIARGLTVRDAEKIAKQSVTEKPRKIAAKPPRINLYSEVEIALRESLGRRVSISGAAGGHGYISVEFHNQEELLQLSKKLSSEDQHDVPHYYKQAISTFPHRKDRR
ncbi:MAG: ParB/RepB/Spo0J family partition protein [Oscillospiraceae bacterium]|nr:ParB/RepB/Spo0J family partition protein [Oscillospiraceae bacterium]